MDDRQLISLVREHPEIYDIFGEDCANKTLKERAWHEIARQLDVTTTACKNKWAIIRNSYIRYMRQKIKWKNKKRDKKKWHLADDMEFMRDYVKLQTRADLSSMIPADVTTTTTTTRTFLNDHSYGETNAPSLLIEPVQTVSNERRSTDLPSDLVSNFLRTKGLDPKETCTNYSHLNFFISLMPDLERLSARRQRKFKEQVMITLNSFLDDEDHEFVETPLPKFRL